MKTFIYSYKKAKLYQEHFPNFAVDRDKYTFVIRAKKSKLHPDGIHDRLGNIPMSTEEAIKKFKEKVDKHLYAKKNW